MWDRANAKEKFWRFLKQRGKRQGQGRQQWRGEQLLGFQAQDRSLAIAAVYQAIDFDLIQCRVDDPIFVNAVMLVPLTFDRFIQFSLAFGQNFNDQGWNPMAA